MHPFAQMCTSDERRAARRTRVVSHHPNARQVTHPGSCHQADKPSEDGFGGTGLYGGGTVTYSYRPLLRACAFVVCSSRSSDSSCLLRSLRFSSQLRFYQVIFGIRVLCESPWDANIQKNRHHCPCYRDSSRFVGLTRVACRVELQDSTRPLSYLV